MHSGPAAFTPEQRRDRGNNWLNALARLKPGVPLEQAQAEMRAIAKRLAQAYPDYNVQDNVRLVPLRTSGMDEHRPPPCLVDDGARRLRAPDRLRERRQPSARPHRFQGSRTRRARGARRGSCPADCGNC